MVHIMLSTFYMDQTSVVIEANDYLITLLNLADHFSIARIDCWESFPTDRVMPFVVDKYLAEQ